MCVDICCLHLPCPLNFHASLVPLSIPIQHRGLTALDRANEAGQYKAAAFLHDYRQRRQAAAAAAEEM